MTGLRSSQFPIRLQTFNSHSHQQATRSLSRAVADLRILFSTMQNRLRKLIYLFPYKIALVHQLQPQIYAQRVAISQSCLDTMSSDSGFLHQTGFSDECFISLFGFVNTTNARVWGTEKLEWFNKVSYTAKRNSLMRWHAISVVGPS